jgi:beta-lactamase superfamily II metal-dependent hydrolase
MKWKLAFPLLILAAACFFVAYESYEGAHAPAPRPMVGQRPLQGPGRVTVAVLDVGQGDSILIRSPEGKTALVDAGPSRDVVKLLRAQGVNALDLVVVSHHHADHYGGMAEVIKTFPTRVFLASDSSHTSTHYLNLLKLVRERRIQAITPGISPRKIALGSVELTVFPQAPEDPHEENNNSVGLRLQYGAFSVLLPGDAQDAERNWWERIVPSLCAESTVLKLAHHGSRNGTDARWLELVRPELAVASLGAGNDYGHPHPETLALLEQMHIPLLRTDRDGTIVIQGDGEHWQVDRHPDRARAPPFPSPGRSGTPTDQPGPHPGSININTATAEELRTVPGIGRVLAERIIAGRPYARVDDLGRVEGIGKKRLAEILPFLTAD